MIESNNFEVNVVKKERERRDLEVDVGAVDELIGEIGITSTE